MKRMLSFGKGGQSSSNSSSKSVVATKDNDKEKRPSFVPENVEVWACSEIEQETFTFLWALKNFSSFTSTSIKLPKDSATASETNKDLATDEVKSPIFKGGSQQNLWQLNINPKRKIDDVDYLSVHLCLTSFGDGDNSKANRKIKARFQISILDSEGRAVQQSGDEELCEFERSRLFGYEEFIRISTLNQNKLILDDDCLKIHCRIWIEGNLKHKTGGSDLDRVSKDDLKVKELHGLSDDFGKLLCLSDMADVSIATPKHTFMAHHLILAARSPVFKRMLEIDMVESKTRSIDIPDFDKEVVQGMLEYMYTGHTPSLFKKAPELMQIAEKYDLGGLKNVCEIQIANNLTVENAVQVLVLAHLHNATVLKPAVISFINRNKDAVKMNKTFQDVAKSNSHAFVDLYLSQV